MSGPSETALVAIASQLKKIQVANGYANDIARVFRQDFRVDQLGEGEVPAAFILPPLQGDEFVHRGAEDVGRGGARIDKAHLAPGPQPRAQPALPFRLTAVRPLPIATTMGAATNGRTCR